VSLLAILIVVFVVLAIVFFVGGYIAAGRRREARETRLLTQIRAADEALAQARAGDRGWDLDLLQSAARAAYASRFAGREPESLHLIQVVDKPGTDADEAIFRAVDGHREEDVVLGREGDRWVAR
jgi:type II secretory pathway pseudopilin PulG